MERPKASVVFIAMAFILVLTIVSIALFESRSFNGTQGFSQLWILGYERKAIDYPYNLNASNSYACQFFVGVKNNLGHHMNYSLRVKLCNQTDLLPNHINSTASPLHSIYQFEFSLPDNETWETAVNFAVFSFDFAERDMLNLTGISINGLTISELNMVLLRTVETHGYPFQIFFELWIYDTTHQEFCYHNRFVSLWLNLQV